jgi:5-methylcytosine-specific restriction protein B
MTTQGVLTKFGSYRIWVLPILRAIEELGGSSTPIAVEEKVRELVREQLNDLQWARVLRGNYIRWARHGLKKEGLIGGKRGEWALTTAGRDFLRDSKDEPISITWKIKELTAAEAGDIRAPLETVKVTDFAAYQIPVLRILAKGPRPKQEIFSEVEKTLKKQLLPGDLRLMPRGRSVLQYRTSWALTDLKKTGDVRNPTLGTWEITEAGRARLKRDDEAWRIESFQKSKAQVRGETKKGDSSAPPSVVPSWPTKRWSDFAHEYEELARAIEQRVRPDLGPSPDLDGALARNIILYGPPGTGKTYLAKKIAVALTGEDEPGPDSNWRVVQFHPSYAYEDFIQGLRPVLEQSALRYGLQKGPFPKICETAEADPDTFHVLIIDEINRGDPARIFGELLYGLEYRDEAVELALGGELKVPPNLIILGTMNSVDRSVALVDYALRRRFAFVRIEPDPEVVAAMSTPQMAAVLDAFNEWLVGQLDREHAIGHSVFIAAGLGGVPPQEALARIWQHDVLPLLEEYFFGQVDRLKAADQKWMEAIASAMEEDEEAPSA